MYNRYTFSEDIELGQLTETKVNHEVIRVWTYRPVYASMEGVRSREHYQASIAGMRPEIVFVVRDFEYDNEERVRHNGKVDDIIRHSYLEGGFYELVGSARTGGEI